VPPAGAVGGTSRGQSAAPLAAQERPGHTPSVVTRSCDVLVRALGAGSLLGVLLVSLGAAAAEPELAVGECVVVQALDGAEERVFGGDECERRTLPASTFKVPHALIALDTGVLSASTVMKWDGKDQPFKVWERDQTLESAIRSSVVWFFQRAAQSIGRERELEHLRGFGYGSQSFKGKVETFWLTGDLQISPREQVAFLRRMFTHELPVDRRHVDAVGAALTMPAGKVVNASGEHVFPLAWPRGTVARLKTGNGSVAGERVSWLIGELESGGHAYVFASRVRSTLLLRTTAGTDLAARVLNTLTP